MKSIVAVCLGAFILFIVSCNKETHLQADNDTGFLHGTWELRMIQSGMMPAINYPAGNNILIQFSATNYQKYQNGNLIEGGTYSLFRDSTVSQEVGLVIPNGQFTHRIRFENDLNEEKTFIEVDGNKLTLLSGYFPTDRGSYMVYERR